MAHGYVGADLAAVCKEAGLMSFKRSLTEHEVTTSLDTRAREQTLKEHLLVTREDILAAFTKVRPSAMREVAIDVPKVSFVNSSLSVVSKLVFKSPGFVLVNYVTRLLRHTYFSPGQNRTRVYVSYRVLTIYKKKTLEISVGKYLKCHFMLS